MGNRQRRQTKRERKVEAKQRRLEELRRAQRRARRRRIVTVLVALGTIAGVVFGVYFSGAAERKARKELNQAAASAGCEPFKKQTLEGSQHVTTPVRYKTTPPTSGDHWAGGAPPTQGPLPTGIHTEPMTNEGQVHNLEHGHVGIQYKDLDKKLIDKLAGFVRGGTHPQWTFLAPYELDDSYKLAFTAWGVSMKCKTPNEKVAPLADKFYKAFGDKATESLPGTPTPATNVAPTGLPTPGATATTTVGTPPEQPTERPPTKKAPTGTPT